MCSSSWRSELLKWSPESSTEDTPTCHYTHTHTHSVHPQCTTGNESEYSSTLRRYFSVLRLELDEIFTFLPSSRFFPVTASRPGDSQSATLQLLLSGWLCLNRWKMSSLIVSGAQGSLRPVKATRRIQPNGNKRLLPAAGARLLSRSQTLSPRWRRSVRELTLSLADALQLERPMTATLMASKLPVKTRKVSGLNNSQRSICAARHSSSSSHRSAVCRSSDGENFLL